MFSTSIFFFGKIYPLQQNTQCSQYEVIRHPIEVLNHSASETENKTINDEPNQEPPIEIEPAKKPSTQKTSSQKPIPNDANNNVTNNVSNDCPLKLYIFFLN